MFTFKNTFFDLPSDFYENVKPTPVSNPKIIKLNKKLYENLDLDDQISNDLLTKVFSGNLVLDSTQPISLKYAGHQFGNFINQLGDGRAILLGEIVNKSNERFDIQLKGSGLTPFSRQGDGRSALGPVIREYVVSEAMFHLGIPTTRALCAVETGEKVMRESIQPGGILTRVARSHIRVGSFEYFASREDWKNVELLLNYSIDRHYPEIKESDEKALEFLRSVASRQSDLMADWMGVGFIHGVMNTDNTSIAGETLDYGPCAFMDSYDPMKVFSSIDLQGRYAFGNQPQICLWNMYCLAGCLMKFIDLDMNKAKEKVEGIMQEFVTNINNKILDVLCLKIGLEANTKRNQQSVKDLLNLMKNNQADYTQTFTLLTKQLNISSHEEITSLFKNDKDFTVWLAEWEKLIHKEDENIVTKRMKSINPVYIPRNHLIEKAIELANEGDFFFFEELNEVLKNPYKEQLNKEVFLKPPEEKEIVKQTFCGT